MDSDLYKIKMKKLAKLKDEFFTGEKNMSENILDKPIDISDSNFDENIKKYPTIVVDCWAPWCGPCRMVSPIIDDLAKEMKGKIVFGKLNVDKNQITASKYAIMSIPSLLIFKNGELKDKIVGAMPKDILKSKLTNYE